MPSAQQSSKSDSKPDSANKAPKPLLQENGPIAEPRSPGVIVPQVQANPNSIQPNDILNIQRTAGNQAVNALLANRAIGSTPVQAKLTLGPVSDQYEQEADRVSQQVVSKLNTSPSATRRKLSTKTQTEESADQPAIQRKTPTAPSGGDTNAITAKTESSIQQARGSGQTLDDGVRTQMEGAFGADFSGVRVHTGAESDSLNRSLQARAFTTGQDIFFRQGAYNPNSTRGKELLAHELTHTVQQGGASLKPKRTAKNPSQATKTASENITQAPDAKIQRAPERMGEGAGQGLRGWIYIANQVFGSGKDREDKAFRRDPANSNDALKAKQGSPYNDIEDVSISSTGDNLLRGRFYRTNVSPPNGQTILFLSGSGGSAEKYGEPVAEKYCRMGANVLAVNYRNFGGSGKEGKGEGKGGSNPSEKGLYDDALNMFNYLKNERDINEDNIVVHGFSLGGPIASTLVAHLAEKGIKVRGLVMHSAMPSAQEAAHDASGSKFAGKQTKAALGAFEAREKLRRIAAAYPDLPLFLIGGQYGNGDQLDPYQALPGSETGNSLMADVQGMKGFGGRPDVQGMGFTNLVNTSEISGSSGRGNHFAPGQHMDSQNVEPGIQQLLNGPQPDVTELQEQAKEAEITQQTS